jgi:hypothetical protein
MDDKEIPRKLSPPDKAKLREDRLTETQRLSQKPSGKTGVLDLKYIEECRKRRDVERLQRYASAKIPPVVGAPEAPVLSLAQCAAKRSRMEAIKKRSHTIIRGVFLLNKGELFTILSRTIVEHRRRHQLLWWVFISPLLMIVTVFLLLGLLVSIGVFLDFCKGL